MITGVLPPLPTSTARSALESTETWLTMGDSSMAGANAGDYDSASVSAGITEYQENNGTPVTYSTGDTTTWDTSSGLRATLAEELLQESAVSTVQILDTSVSGSRFVTHRVGQVTQAKQAALSLGWTPKVAVLFGLVNDVTANGAASDGEWQDGTAMDLASVQRRVTYWAVRLRVAWPQLRLLVCLPPLEAGTYPQADDLRSWLSTWAAGVGNCAAVDLSGATLADDKHIDNDHATGGNIYVSAQIIAAATE